MCIYHHISRVHYQGTIHFKEPSLPVNREPLMTYERTQCVFGGPSKGPFNFLIQVVHPSPLSGLGDMLKSFPTGGAYCDKRVVRI